MFINELLSPDNFYNLYISNMMRSRTHGLGVTMNLIQTTVSDCYDNQSQYASFKTRLKGIPKQILEVRLNLIQPEADYASRIVLALALASGEMQLTRAAN